MLEITGAACGKGVRPGVGVAIGVGKDVRLGVSVVWAVAVACALPVPLAVAVAKGVRPGVGVCVTVNVEEDVTVRDPSDDPFEGALPHATNIVQPTIIRMSKVITLVHLADTVNLLLFICIHIFYEIKL